MFLPQLYKHNKWLFAIVALFIIFQLFINVKRGMVVSPFYHYGMYSDVMEPAPSYQVLEVWANGKQLQGKDYTPWTWDKIMMPLTWYSSIPNSNNLYRENIQRLAGSLHLQTNELQFLQRCDYPAFEQGYKIYLGNLLHQPVTSIDLRSRTWQYSAATLQPTNNVQPLSNLCR